MISGSKLWHLSAASLSLWAGNLCAERDFWERGVGFETIELSTFDELLGELFNLDEEVKFIRGDERDRLAL